MSRDDREASLAAFWAKEAPWNEPSEWYLYRCRSCDCVTWTENIIFDGFPPAAPGDGPALVCLECNGETRWDRNIPTKHSWTEPPLPQDA